MTDKEIQETETAFILTPYIWLKMLLKQLARIESRNTIWRWNNGKNYRRTNKENKKYTYR